MNISVIILSACFLVNNPLNKIHENKPIPKGVVQNLLQIIVQNQKNNNRLIEADLKLGTKGFYGFIFFQTPQKLNTHELFFIGEEQWNWKKIDKWEFIKGKTLKEEPEIKIDYDELFHYVGTISYLEDH